MHSLTNIKASLFLESSRGVSIGDVYQKELYNSLMTIQKKLPDRVDIFNNQNNEAMTEKFEQLVQQEEDDLGKFLTAAKVHEIINETYNLVDEGDVGNLTLGEFQDLVNEILPGPLKNSMNSSRIL